MAAYREIPLLYMMYDEALSFLSGENAEKLSDNHSTSTSSFGTPDTHLYSGNSSIWKPQMTNLGLSGRFPSAPTFSTMNGYIFANNPTFEMCLGDKVIWYVNAYTMASHVFHMHGNYVTEAGENSYAVSLNDGAGHTLYMDATGQGLWQVICHVADHQQKGMVANYRVYGEGECPLAKLA